MNAQAAYLLYFNCKEYPQKIISIYMVYIVSLLILFANFFIVSYMTDSSAKKHKKALKKEE